MIYSAPKILVSLLSFGLNGTADGEFASPCGVAVDGGGNIYVADTGNDRMQIFDSTGMHLLSFGTMGAGDGNFDSPVACSVDSAT